MSLTERSHRWVQLVVMVFPSELVTLILDDALVPRCAKFGPRISIKHDHSHRAKRPTLLNSKCWVKLTLVIRVRLGSAPSVAIRFWLSEKSGQCGKLWVARQLRDSIGWHHTNGAHLLIDAWFMRCTLILRLVEQQIRTIGDVRLVTA